MIVSDHRIQEICSWTYLPFPDTCCLNLLVFCKTWGLSISPKFRRDFPKVSLIHFSSWCSGQIPLRNKQTRGIALLCWREEGPLHVLGSLSFGPCPLIANRQHCRSRPLTLLALPFGYAGSVLCMFHPQRFDSFVVLTTVHRLLGTCLLCLRHNG